MESAYDVRIGNRSVIAESERTLFNAKKAAIEEKTSSYLHVQFHRTAKFLYLLSGIAGLSGALIITFKVINLASISSLNMVLIFGAACLSLVVMRAGFYGFFELIKEGK